MEQEQEINNLKELLQYVSNRKLRVINRIGDVVILDNETTLLVNFDELGETI